MLSFIYGLLLFTSVFLVGFYFGGSFVMRVYGKKLLTKENVYNCFKNVDWTQHTFSYGPNEIKASNGSTHFYKAKPIDEAIKKLYNLQVEIDN